MVNISLSVIVSVTSVDFLNGLDSGFSSSTYCKQFKIQFDQLLLSVFALEYNTQGPVVKIIFFLMKKQGGYRHIKKLLISIRSAWHKC